MTVFAHREDLTVFPADGITISCQAVLSDLDGTLIDSTQCVDYAVETWARRRNLEVAKVVDYAHGRRTADTVKQMVPHLDQEHEITMIEDLEVSCTKGLVCLPGSHELISAFSSHHWAVVTSGSNRLATHRLTHVGLPIPRVFVTADDVVKGKPNPEPYLLAAAKLGLEPQECLALEDSPNGIKAAKRAGMRTIAIAACSADFDISEADYKIHDLSWVTLRITANSHLQLTLRKPL